MRCFVHWVIDLSFLALFREHLQNLLQVSYSLFYLDILLLLGPLTLNRVNSMVSGSFTFNILQTLVSAELGKGVDHFEVALHGCDHERRPTISILSIYICTMINQQLDKTRIFTLAGKVNYTHILTRVYQLRGEWRFLSQDFQKERFVTRVYRSPQGRW